MSYGQTLKQFCELIGAVFIFYPYSKGCPSSRLLALVEPALSLYTMLYSCGYH
jgi:hypothetical protein